MGDQVIRLAGGRVVATGTPHDVLAGAGPGRAAGGFDDIGATPLPELRRG
jgi:hypothetical protein